MGSPLWHLQQPRSSWQSRRRAEEAAGQLGLVAWQVNSYYCAGRVVVPALMDTFTCQAFFSRVSLGACVSSVQSGACTGWSGHPYLAVLALGTWRGERVRYNTARHGRQARAPARALYSASVAPLHSCRQEVNAALPPTERRCGIFLLTSSFWYGHLQRWAVVDAPSGVFVYLFSHFCIFVHHTYLPDEATANHLSTHPTPPLSPLQMGHARVQRLLPGLMTELCGDDGRPGGTMLRQIPVPPEWVGRTYLELFRHLSRDCGLVPLGLYRMKGENAAWRMAYVATNPGWADELQATDQVFVLRRREPLDDVMHRE